MEVPHTIGKLNRVPVELVLNSMSNTSDGMSKSVQLGSQRADERGCAPSESLDESLDITMSIADECEPRRLDTDIDVSSPRKTRVRFRSLVDVCPVDPPVGRKQVPVHSKQVRNKQEVPSSKYVCLFRIHVDGCRRLL